MNCLLLAKVKKVKDVDNVEKAVEKNNKKIGNDFEKDFADYLAKNGCRVAPFPGKDHTNSQPADNIACKNNEPFLFDCKTLANKNGLFPIHRIEENQRLAYKRFKQTGNKKYYLAILWNNNVYLVNLDNIDFTAKSIDLKNEISIEENFYEEKK